MKLFLETGLQIPSAMNDSQHDYLVALTAIGNHCPSLEGQTAHSRAKVLPLAAAIRKLTERDADAANSRHIGMGDIGPGGLGDPVINAVKVVHRH